MKHTDETRRWHTQMKHTDETHRWNTVMKHTDETHRWITQMKHTDETHRKLIFCVLGNWFSESLIDVRRVVLTALERSSSMAWIVSTKATGKKQSTLPCNVIQCVVHSMLYEIVCKVNRTSSHTQLEIIQVVDETSSTTWSNDPTIQRSNDLTIQRSNDPTIQRSNVPNKIWF